jgi:hypothetical protein
MTPEKSSPSGNETLSAPTSPQSQRLGEWYKRVESRKGDADMERTWSCFDCRFDDAEPLCFTAGGTFDPQRLARMLLKVAPAEGDAAEEKSDRLRAHDCIDEMVQAAPGPAVAFILAALDVCQTGAQVALLGAGPLETLLKTQGPEAIGALETAAREHAKVRYLLSATWGETSIDPAVWTRLAAAVAPGPVMDADARTPAAGLHDKILDTDGVAALLSKPMA